MINKFIDYIKFEKHYSNHTVIAYQRDLLDFCAFHQQMPEDFNPATVKEEEIRQWLLHLLDKHQTPRTVNRKISALKSYWKFCLRTGLLKEDILQKIIPPKMAKPLPAFYKESEMNEALSQANSADDFESVRNNLIIRMLYETGMRRAELIGLHDTDFNYTDHTIKVLGKGNKERMIPFGDDLQQAINHYLTWRKKSITSDNSFFFVLKNGKPLYPKAVYNIVHIHMSEVSTLHKQSPHVLRHTFATAMLNNGADINAVKELLGHANLAATQIYTNTTFDEIHQIYKHAHPRA